MARTISSFLDRHHFLLRRLHSLSGIVPIGLFLIVHLLTNSSILWAMANARADHLAEGDLIGRGVVTFAEEVQFINELPYLLLIELTLWLSIAFHAVLGAWYALTGRVNVREYGYGGNVRYALQRLSGWVAIVYIFYHIATLRWGWTFLVPGETAWTHERAASTLTLALRGGTDFTLGGLIVSLFYFVGITAVVFHFANGLWTAAITWGVTVSAAAQRRWGYVCAAAGVVLMAMAWGALAGFVLLDPDKAATFEARMRPEVADAEPATTQDYPWPGTEEAVELERRKGPLQR
ncbi:MAG: hypothetical protein ACF8R7_11125 [Phycisphaerales bacterium JB039]